MEWINQKKSKPSHSNNVLVTDQINVWIGDYSHNRERRQGGWAVVYDGAPSVNSEDITHWMELPHPMKGYANTK